MRSARSIIVKLVHGVALAALLLAPGLAAQPAAAEPPGPDVTGGSPPISFNSKYLWSCGQTYDGTFTTASATFVSAVGCNLVVDTSGTVIVLASASVGLAGAGQSYEANFRVDYNSGTGDPRTERFVDAFPDNTVLPLGDGTDRNVGITSMYTVTAGYHAFALLVKRSEGTGTVELIDPSISVLFVADSTDLQICAEQSSGLWVNNTNNLTPTVKCSLEVPRPGLVWTSADAWMLLESPYTAPYESEHMIVMDGVISSSTGVRYTNVYTNTGDGVDATVAASRPFTVTPGLHEFKLMFRRDSADPATARMAGAGLVALYVPFDSAYAQACAKLGPAFTSLSADSFTELAGCSLSVARESWVFMSGTASVGLIDQEHSYEAAFGLSIDGTNPIASTSRYINSYPDGHDGLDASMTDTVLMQMQPGTHTYKVVGRMFTGDGPAGIRYPSLFVLVPRAQYYLPVSLGQ